jgi:hypothetical protein
MQIQAAMSEELVLEIPDRQRAEDLRGRLCSRWPVTLDEGADAVVVRVSLRRSDTCDLAGLLREVETWVEERTLCAIRFHLDGRTYILEAGEASWASLAA